MGVVIVTHERFARHEAGLRHPERPERLAAVRAGLETFDADGGLEWVEARSADVADIAALHRPELVERLETIDAAGGGSIDLDTAMGPDSWSAALLAAGAGLTAVEALADSTNEAGFCLVRPPGHHATRSSSMGFCLLNNIAITARSLSRSGARVVIVDFDAHHGNGTQDAFDEDSSVLFISLHQWPLYPGTGRGDEVGVGSGYGTTLNVPLPPGSSGDLYRESFDRLIVPAVERFGADWVLVSAGFDGHRADPLTEMGLTAGDFGDFVGRLRTLVPSGQLIAFLEGGYDLEALEVSTASTVAALLDDDIGGEALTNNGPRTDSIDRLATHHPALGENDS